MQLKCTEEGAVDCKALQASCVSHTCSNCKMCSSRKFSNPRPALASQLSVICRASCSQSREGREGGGSGYSGIISRLYSDYQLSQSALQHMYCLARSCLKSGLVCCAEPCLLYNIIYNAVDKQSSDNGGLDSVGHLQAVLQFDCQFFSQLGKECGLQ